MPHIKQSILPAIGAPLAGGFFAGLFRLQGQLHALIVSPKAAGQIGEIEWGRYGQKIDSADSCIDGLANTRAMADAGSDLAQQMLALCIADQRDWYLPSRDELELCYRQSCRAGQLTRAEPCLKFKSLQIDCGGFLFFLRPL